MVAPRYTSPLFWLQILTGPKPHDMEHPIPSSAGQGKDEAGLDATGYAHADYAASLAAFGTPRHLRRCDGWILERQIPGTPYRDAIGPYPLFSCRDWSHLAEDLRDIGTELVSLMIVPAPFDAYDPTLLNRCFSRVIPFKSHYVADLTQPIDRVVKKSHRAAVARASKKVQVSHCAEPESRLAQWVDFFHTLAERHHITG